MTREDALKLLEQRYNQTYEEEKLFDDFAYYGAADFADTFRKAMEE